MLQTIENVNAAVNNFVWGVPAMVCIIGVGLVLSARTGFIQFRKFGYAIKNSIGRIFTKSEAKEGSITPFQAVCTALAATVGTGNIAGVAGAIAIGGAGAVFWMWVSALLGMCTKFSEVTLAVHYREKNAEGDYVGGPMYYIKNGLGKKWYWMASVYAILGSLTVLGTGNATQVNTITTSIDSALISYNVIDDAQISMVNLVIGIVIAALVAVVLLGGVKRIGTVTERCQPPVAGDQLIAAVRQRPCQRRRKHAGIGNAPHELRHFLVLLHLEGVISKGCEGSQRDCLYLWLFRIEPFLRAHKKLLVPGQPQINQSVVLHRILPFIA